MDLHFPAETGRGQEAEPSAAPQLCPSREWWGGFAYLMIGRPAAVVAGFEQYIRVPRGTGRGGGAAGGDWRKHRGVEAEYQLWIALA